MAKTRPLASRSELPVACPSRRCLQDPSRLVAQKFLVGGAHQMVGRTVGHQPPFADIHRWVAEPLPILQESLEQQPVGHP